MNEMVDMHSHILFHVDDGPKNFDETLAMLKQAVNEGITEIIATSHAKHPQYHTDFGIVETQVQQLTIELERQQIPLKIYTGHEVRLNENLTEQIKSKEIHTLANSRYLLLELPSSNVPHYTKSFIRELVENGITPIIAHPERNKAIAEKPERLENLVREGALAQITAGSLAGHFGKSIQKTSVDLVRANLIHTYGSDVHNLTTRPFLFDAGLTVLEKAKLGNQVEILLENNARILANDGVILFEPEKIAKKWWKLFS